jgi:Tol biopolymer transport system component
VNVVPGQADANGARDVFLRDRVAGTTTLVSRTPDSPVTTGNSGSPLAALSADGRFVAFESRADNLVAGQAEGNAGPDVFLYDREAGTTTLVSRSALSAVTTGNGPSRSPVLSADGRFVAFVSEAGDLVAGQVDPSSDLDVFLYDRELGTTALVSRTALSAVTAGDQPSRSPVLSADGRFVAFVSRATNLVPLQADTSLSNDVFLYDRVGATTTLVSRTSASGATTGNESSDSPSLSADGAFVVFVSPATDLVGGQVDDNGQSDVFLYDRVAATTTLVSRRPGSAVATGTQGSAFPVLSADGRFVAFVSHADDLVAGQADDNAGPDVFLYDRVAETTTLVSRAAASPLATGDAGAEGRPTISGDGRFVAFLSAAADLVAGQTERDVLEGLDGFLYDRESGTTTLVTRAVAEARAGRGLPPATGGLREPLGLSLDGSVVVFTSEVGDLAAGDDDVNGEPDVYAWVRPCEGRPCPAPASRRPR